MTDRHQLKPYPLRMPEELRTKLEAAAEQGGRSLHAEILMRLESTVSEERIISGVSLAELFRQMEGLKRLIEEGKWQPFDSKEAIRKYRESQAKETPKKGSP